MLDIFIIILLIIFIIIGFKKGLLCQIINFAGGLIALLIAFYLSGAVANIIYNSFFQDAIREKVENVVVQTIKESDEQSLEAVLDVLPGYVKNKINFSNEDKEGVANALTETTKVASEKIEKIVSPTIKSLIISIVSIILFIVLKIAVRILAKFLDGLANLPIISQINSLTAAIFGFAEGVLTVGFIVLIINMVTPMLTNIPEFLQPESIEDTAIYSQFNSIANNILYDK